MYVYVYMDKWELFTKPKTWPVEDDSANPIPVIHVQYLHVTMSSVVWIHI